MTASKRLRSVNRSKSIVVALAVILVLAAIGVAQASFGQSASRHLGIAAKRQSYTELYFSNPQDITSLVENFHHGTLQEAAGFVIQNDDHVSINYQWTITVDGSFQASGQQALGPGQQRFIDPPTTLNCGDARRIDPSGPRELKVSVALARPSESISYLVNCGG